MHDCTIGIGQPLGGCLKIVKYFVQHSPVKPKNENYCKGVYHILYVFFQCFDLF